MFHYLTNVNKGTTAKTLARKSLKNAKLLLYVQIFVFIIKKKQILSVLTIAISI